MHWSRAVAILLALVLQTSVLPHLLPVGIVPDLLLVFAVLTGLYTPPRQAVWWGAAAGFLADVNFGRFVGFHLVTKAAVAYGASVAGSKFYPRHPGVLAALGGLAALGQELVMYVLLRAYGLHLTLLPSLTRIVLPHALTLALLTAILSPVAYHAFTVQPPAKG